MEHSDPPAKVASTAGLGAWVHVLESMPAEGQQVLLWVQAWRRDYQDNEEGQEVETETDLSEVSMGECRRSPHTGDLYLVDWMEGRGGDGEAVTHWMPMPAAPVSD